MRDFRFKTKNDKQDGDFCDGKKWWLKTPKDPDSNPVVGNFYRLNIFLRPTPTLMAFTGVTNAHGPSTPSQQHAGLHHAV